MPPSRQRKGLVAVLSACFLVLLLALMALNGFNFKALNPSTSNEVLLFTGLSIFAFVLCVVVGVLLLRNILKLFAEQRSRVLGSRLRTRMLVWAAMISILPVFFMFLFSYLLLNRSIDRWFSQPITTLREDSGNLADELAQYTTDNARSEADALALVFNDPQDHFSSESRTDLEKELGKREVTLQGGFSAVYSNGRQRAAFHLPVANGAPLQVKSWLIGKPGVDEDTVLSDANTVPPAEPQTVNPSQDASDNTILQAAQRNDDHIFAFGSTQYALATAWVEQGGVIVVGLPLPAGMSATVARLHSDTDSYWAIFRARRQVRATYMFLLFMISGLTFFASTWLALQFSTQITRPVEALADAMGQIAAGHYAHRVDTSATEELGDLAASFNRMAEDLSSSRTLLDQSNLRISAVNTALDERRREVEIMLETIPNGVVMLDREGRIVLANRAFSEMMDPGGQQPFIGLPLHTIFPPEVSQGLDKLIRRSHRMGSASSEFEIHAQKGLLSIVASVAVVDSGNASGSTQRPGGSSQAHAYVVVLEDVTELLRAQKQVAWKEVARRVAHEIKNPLTPVALSSERILKHIGRLDALHAEHTIESPSNNIIRKCSEIITSSVETMRDLVDQFSSLAQFPASRLRPADLNVIVENAMAIFAGRLQGITLKIDLAADLPLVMADPEAMKRALTNLIDNAAEAMQPCLLRELTLSTALVAGGHSVELSVADTGPGVTDEMRERLFLPYFSTKERGTGLGLTITAKIVQEHEGSIRAVPNLPTGSIFIIELPIYSFAEEELDPLPRHNEEEKEGMNHVLIVDDETEIRNTLEGILREEGYAVTTTGTATEGLELLRDASYDVVLLDIWLPDADGLDTLAEIRRLESANPPEVIMISGHGTIESAVKATKLGAYDFLEKPLSMERTLILLKNAIQSRQLRDDNQEFQRQLASKGEPTGESVPIKALRQQIKLMAPTNGRVLIYGESGTGKELIARSIHSGSQRSDRVFVELNCAAIPEDHIESELFGYRNSAGPGDPPEMRGTFERAGGGTLFLNEVGDMSLKTQAKVLRALDEQRVTPVGSAHSVHVDVRVIAATNKDLEEEIARGNFREDLFYRLNVIPFFVPPLRDRREDIPLLVKEFMLEFGRLYGRPRVEMAEDALASLKQYQWPGNLRELRNVIERVLILNPKINRIEKKHLPVLTARATGREGKSPKTEEFSTLTQAREAYERDYILKKMQECHGNMSRTAEALGLERSHLYRKMKALGINVKE